MCRSGECAACWSNHGRPSDTPQQTSDEEPLKAAIIHFAGKYGRYGYRRIQALLEREGWLVNHKRIERIWRQEGLKVPQKQPKRSRLWLNDGSCIRLRPCWSNYVWSYGFVLDRTHERRAFRILVVIDEFTRECLALVISRQLRSDDVLHCLARLSVEKGTRDFIWSDNCSELAAHAVRAGSARLA